MLGAWLALGGANTLHFLVRSRAVLVFGLAYLLFAAVMTLSGLIPELQTLLPRALFEAFNPNDKTNLAPYRFLHLAIVIILGARFIPIDAAALQAAIWKPLIKCGQQSLEVFAVGIYLAFIGIFYPDDDFRRDHRSIAGWNRRHRNHDGCRLLPVMVEAR